MELRSFLEVFVDREGAGNGGLDKLFLDETDDGQGSSDHQGLRGTRGRAETPPAGGASPDHPGDSPKRARSAICRKMPSITRPRRLSPTTKVGFLELESLISRAEVIDVTKLTGDRIKFGATVKLFDEDTEEEKTYQIVGEPEADVRSGRVSVTSPIARALMGKTIGDTVEVTTPGGGKSYEVVGVRFR